MPTIAEFDGIKIYHRDHLPPHFHVEYAGQEAELAIANLEILAGTLPSTLYRKVRAWAEPRLARLSINWVKCQNHIAPDRL